MRAEYELFPGQGLQTRAKRTIVQASRGLRLTPKPKARRYRYYPASHGQNWIDWKILRAASRAGGCVCPLGFGIVVRLCAGENVL